MFKYLKKNIIEILLGVGLGLGFLTSYRFFGKIGVSEILILIVLLILFNRYYKLLFKIPKNFGGVIKTYLLFSFLILTPIVTLGIKSVTNYNSTPIYLISFGMGVLLMFLLDIAYFDRFNHKSFVFWFGFTYIVANLIFMYLNPQALENFRFKSGAKNPNQLMFYSNSIFLLLGLYNRKYFFIFTPIIIYITLKTKSDAFNLSLFVIPVVYLILKLFYVKKMSLVQNLFSTGLILLIPLYYILTNYYDNIVEMWYGADEGGGRILLMNNALNVAETSPIFGYGVGSFSGFEMFHKSEAHNTFLDLAMQFGFIVPSVIYLIMFMYFLKNIKQHNFFIASLVFAYIITGFFHFSGRHFVFWVELSIFYHFIFNNRYYVRH